MAQAGKLRIIGGAWRGRRLTVADSKSLRPTPDRVRETLFNWLEPVIAGARCLDLFAGTGALGLEALSRGAAECLFVERDRRLAATIEASLRGLNTTAGRVIHSDGISALTHDLNGRFDIVFLDPPFAEDLIAPALAQLPPRLSAAPRVYLEYPAAARPQLPAGWRLLREKQAGQVGYCLATLPAGDQDTAP